MKKYSFASLVLLFLFSFGACTSTTLQSSWKAPGATYTKEQFKKVMVVALLKDETTRRIAEDKLASKDTTFRQSYEVFGVEQKDMDEPGVKNFLAQNGYDGIVTMNLIDDQKTTTYVPGTYQGGYYGWYGMYYGGYYSPGYYTENQNYVIETNVFSVSQNKVLWSGITTTTNPIYIEKTIDEVWDAVISRMKQQGFIRGKK
ncbi:hypothetical protein [uncultured Cytophaga sp.]|uniref:hypothetical protein n=1 Tax=uncultured Cytophaga sp. TaxID=160238 RepID=UPI00261BD50C|nr:hypothetical protein [uncultured Cytophaga sp.]